MTPAAAVASSWYVRARPLEFNLVIPVTMSTAAVPSALMPALAAPAGAPRVAESVTPAGIATPMLAVIFAPVWLQVTAQVLPADVTLVGALPATAALMSMVGAPVTPI